jgi:hypothetical protein
LQENDTKNKKRKLEEMAEELEVHKQQMKKMREEIRNNNTARINK